MSAFERVQPSFRTPRLSLRPIGPADRDSLHSVFVDPDVRKYLLDGQVVTAEWVDEEIRRSRALFRGRGCGLWGVRPGSPEGGATFGSQEGGAASLIGFAGIRPFFEPPRLQLLYGLAPGWWGMGLATEAAAAVVSYLFHGLGWDRIEAATDRPNTASVRVLERLGMVLEKETDEGEAGTLFYVLPRSSWAPGLHAAGTEKPPGEGDAAP